MHRSGPRGKPWLDVEGARSGRSAIPGYRHPWRSGEWYRASKRRLSPRPDDFCSHRGGLLQRAAFPVKCEWDEGQMNAYSVIHATRLSQDRCRPARKRRSPDAGDTFHLRRGSVTTDRGGIPQSAPEMRSSPPQGTSYSIPAAKFRCRTPSSLPARSAARWVCDAP